MALHYSLGSPFVKLSILFIDSSKKMNVCWFLGDDEQPFADVPEQSQVSMATFPPPPDPSQSDSLSLSENLLF